MPKTLFLVDGHAVCYKYYYGTIKGPTFTSYGENTSTTFGMAKLITTIMQGFQPTHLAVIFDPAGGNWRRDIYPEYKANRTKPDDISFHLARSFEMLKTWGIYTSAFAKLEADDVIGAITKRAEAKGFTVTIVTKDKDYAQLVNDRVKLLDLGNTIGKDKATFIDHAGVVAKWGVAPSQIIDYLSICGDVSDNIKGVDGIGKKWASTLLSKYGSIGGIYQNLDKLTKSQKKKFEDSREALKLAKRLVTMVTEVKLPFELETALATPQNLNAEILDMFRRLEFHTVIQDLTSGS